MRGWIYFQLDGDIQTFGEDGISADRPPTSANGSNVLVIGSDARSGDNAASAAAQEDIGRSDTALLLHVYADQKHAVAVSIPRDTLVDIPACKLPHRQLDQAAEQHHVQRGHSVGLSAKGNPACTQNTVEKLTGLRVDHTVVVDFMGFAKMTEAVGGVQVCLPQDSTRRTSTPTGPPAAPRSSPRARRPSPVRRPWTTYASAMASATARTWGASNASRPSWLPC